MRPPIFQQVLEAAHAEWRSVGRAARIALALTGVMLVVLLGRTRQSREKDSGRSAPASAPVAVALSPVALEEEALRRQEQGVSGLP